MLATFKSYSAPRIKKEHLIKTSYNSDLKKFPVQVYCRLKPLANNQHSKSCVTIKPSLQELFFNTTESKCKNRDISYKFKHIFSENSSQKEVFNYIACPLVEDLLKGKSGVLFAYGLTGSGKTYTLTGDHQNPGIIPRCIFTIFNSVSNLQTQRFLIKPNKMNGFVLQAKEEALKEEQIKREVLKKRTKSENKINNPILPNFSDDSTKIPVFSTNLYAIFISYIEVYNNHIYDLLDESSTDKNLRSKILREDFNRNMYVNGVVEVEVKSANEAFDLLSIGQKRKKKACTNLNSESSRSHSIFSIKIVQVETVNTDTKNAKIGPEKSFLVISQLNLIDLAGSERSNRTQNTGQRLKETSCINNSLMTLRKCLEVLRENQQKRENKIVPYRDSKLTYLFKNYFEGEGNMQIMVCVHPSMDNLEENLQVMKFAVMTQDIKTLISKVNFIPTNTMNIISRENINIPKTNLYSVTEFSNFKFNVNEVEECGYAIENVLNKLNNSKLKMEKLDIRIDKKSRELRKHLVEISNQEILEKDYIGNLNQLSCRQTVKNNNLNSNVIRLATQNNIELEQTPLHVMEKETQLKINQSILDKQCDNIILDNEILNQELEAKLHKERNNLCFSLMATDLQLKNIKKSLEFDINNISPPSNLFTTFCSESSLTTLKGYTSRKRSKSIDKKWVKQWNHQ